MKTMTKTPTPYLPLPAIDPNDVDVALPRTEPDQGYWAQLADHLIKGRN